MTLKEFRELTKDMREDAILEFYHYNILGGHQVVHDAEYIEDDNTIELC